MTKQEFLDGLRKELYFLPPDEIDDAVRYYDELISEGGEEAIDELGTPQKAAESFRNEYYSKEDINKNVPMTNMGSSPKISNVNIPLWVWVIIIIFIVAFGIPIFKVIIGSSIFASVFLILIIVLLIVFLLKRSNNPVKLENNYEVIETCSDIENIDINFTAGVFAVMSGDSFHVDEDNSISSSIRNNTWYISGNASNVGNIQNVIKVTVPKNVNIKNAKIRLRAGSMLINGISADRTEFSVDMGKMEAKSIYSQGLILKCGTGHITADACMHGNVDILCGMGSIDLELKNRVTDFNYSAVVGMGKTVIGSYDVNGMGGRIEQNNGALNNMNVKCGMGSTSVKFI